MAPRLRVAIDTNILLSGLLWRGTPHLVLELGKEGEIRLVVPEVVRWEASRVVGKLRRGSEGALERFFQLLGARVQMVPVPSKDAVVEASRFVRDATDAPIVASVIAARPDYFISGGLSPSSRTAAAAAQARLISEDPALRYDPRVRLLSPRSGRPNGLWRLR